MRLFVGNLAFSVSDQDLRNHFEDNGFTPTDLKVMTDRETSKSRGFAFVSFSSEDEANRAIQQLDTSLVAGRDLRLSIAHERPARPGGAPTPRQNQAPRNAAAPERPSQQSYSAPQERRPPPNRQEEPRYTKPQPSYPANEWGEQGGKGGDRRRDDRPKGKNRRNDDDWE